WQADIATGRVQKAVRAGRPQMVKAGRAGHSYRIVGGGVAPPPTVQHGEHPGTPMLHLHPLVGHPSMTVRLGARRASASAPDNAAAKLFFSSAPRKPAIGSFRP